MSQTTLEPNTPKRRWIKHDPDFIAKAVKYAYDHPELTAKYIGTVFGVSTATVSRWLRNTVEPSELPQETSHQRQLNDYIGVEKKIEVVDSSAYPATSFVTHDLGLAAALATFWPVERCFKIGNQVNVAFKDSHDVQKDVDAYWIEQQSVEPRSYLSQYFALRRRVQEGY